VIRGNSIIDNGVSGIAVHSGTVGGISIHGNILADNGRVQLWIADAVTGVISIEDNLISFGRRRSAKFAKSPLIYLHGTETRFDSNIIHIAETADQKVALVLVAPEFPVGAFKSNIIIDRLRRVPVMGLINKYSGKSRLAELPPDNLICDGTVTLIGQPLSRASVQLGDNCPKGNVSVRYPHAARAR